MIGDFGSWLSMFLFYWMGRNHSWYIKLQVEVLLLYKIKNRIACKVAVCFFVWLIYTRTYKEFGGVYVYHYSFNFLKLAFHLSCIHIDAYAYAYHPSHTYTWTFKWVHAVLIRAPWVRSLRAKDDAQIVIIFVLMVLVVLLWLMERSAWGKIQN